MGNADIAALFGQMGDMMEILGEDPFRINSYRNAARTLAETSEDLAQLAQQGEKALQKIPAVGKATAAKIIEYCKTGRIARHQELLAQVPPGLPAMLNIQGLGPKTILKLWREGGITSVDELRQALAERPDKLAELHGMGERKLTLLKDALVYADSSTGRARLDEALRVAEIMLSVVRGCAGVCRVEVAGSLRRWRETVGDIDLLCQCAPADAEAVVAAFTAAPGVARVLARGKTKGSILYGQGIQVDLRVVPEESFGAALQYFTGAKAHNIALRGRAIERGMKLNEYGLFEEAGGQQGRQLAGADEQGIYQVLGLAWVPPELREGLGEVEAAAENRLPELVQLSDMRGDFHMHTTASDGANSIDEMIDACRALGYRLLAITEHSHSQHQARGLSEEDLLAHIGRVHDAARRHPDMLVLAGTEVDILKDGRLDYDDALLAKLDFVLASPHAALTQKGDEATGRLIRAIESGRVHAIGHPTGRLVNQRAGLEIDIMKVAQAAAARGVAFEVNADPSRLDLRDIHVRAAIEAGAAIIINTDAHSTDGLSLMRFGVATARRGWARAQDVINTWPTERLREWLRAAFFRNRSLGPVH